MNLIMDQAMMENYKFVWYVHDTYLNHSFVIKKKYKDRIKLKSLLSPKTELTSQFPIFKGVQISINN